MISRTASRLARLLCVALVSGALADAGAASLHAQSNASATSAEQGVVPAGLLIRQLDGVKRVLMIGAHPDDEDTGMLAALARGEGARVAYLSLNRGEGGQNLIGPEMDEGLGIIRTGELLAARALDGAEQYFTRAFDFGFSKSAEETFGHWPREAVLDDVVRVIRTFRPQVIVSVFSGTPSDGHGQHQVAGMLAEEAFQVAGDGARFPHHSVAGAEPWQPLKLYRLVWRTPQDATVSVETGRFDPLLGRSHFQLAMESRSQHRSQDMGAGQPAGPRESGLRLERSRVSLPESGEGSIFTGIDTTLQGLVDPARSNGMSAADENELRERLTEYRSAVADASEALDPFEPWNAAAHLVDALEAVKAAAALLDDPATELARVLHEKSDLAEAALLGAAGLVLDVRVSRDLIVPGDPVRVEVELWNGGPFMVDDAMPGLVLPPGWEARALQLEQSGRAQSGPGGGVAPGAAAGGAVPAPVGGFRPSSIAPGAITRWSFQVSVPHGAEPSRLYYLEEEREGALYRWPADSELRGRPGNPPLLEGSVHFLLSDRGSEARASGASAPEPVRPARARASRGGRYVSVDKALGEFSKPVLVVPALSVAVEPDALVWPLESTEPRTVVVRVERYSAGARRGEVSLEVPDGWSVSPDRHAFEWNGDGGPGSTTGAEEAFAFEVRPGERGPGAGFHRFEALVTTEDGRDYREGFDLIDYPHMERVAHFHAAQTRVSAFQVQVREGLRAGYIMGSGDAGFETLRQLGMNVELLDADAVRRGDFRRFDVIVVGVRAYETRPDLVAANDRLIDFARQGGTVVVQYNKYEYPAGNFAPYPVEMSRPHDRVTDAEAPVVLLEPDSPVFRTPNRITEADFQGWVQERGLYFLGAWDDRFTPLMEMADPGEEMKRGALLVAPVGEGLYVYTGLAFFRQLPAGVPGAHRLFANLVSLRAEEWARAQASGEGEAPLDRGAPGEADRREGRSDRESSDGGSR